MAAVAAGLLFGLLAVPRSTWSAFSATTANAGNTSTASTVVLADNDGGSAMLTLSSALPGGSDTGCIQVTYSGTASAVVRMYGTTTGTGLDPYLDMTITRGTVSSGSFDSCTNFTADATNYLGLGNGVIYNGTVQGLVDDYLNGVPDPTPSRAETWTATETHAYKIQVTLQNDVAAQGLTATQTFTWEARNTGVSQAVQYPGTTGCFSQDGSSGACTVSAQLGGSKKLVVSPDGESAYAMSATSDAINVFDRDTTTGGLTQLAGTSGCYSETGDGGACTDGKAMDDLRAGVISSDGKNLYALGRNSDAVVAFSRNTSTGVLTQLASTNGCISETGTGGTCVDGKALDSPWGIAVSPDGEHVYAVSEISNAIAAFDRNPTTGVITQLAGTSGCISETGTSGTCVDGVALDDPRSVVVSPDGNYVYVSSAVSDAVAVFSRNSSTGALTQLTSTSACISETGTSGTCADGKALDGAYGIEVSPDGANIYVAAGDSQAVAVFARNSSTGVLTQSSTTSGCVSETGTSGACVDGRGLDDAVEVGVSPDGKMLYSAAVATGSNTLGVFSRNPDTGAITQAADISGCVHLTGAGTCGDGSAIDGPRGVSFSPDNRNLYLATETSNSIAIFLRTN